MWSGADALSALRLLVLLTATQGGVPKRHWDGLRQEFVAAYGHQHLLTLHGLERAGAVQRQARGPERRAGRIAALPRGAAAAQAASRGVSCGGGVGSGAPTPGCRARLVATPLAPLNQAYYICSSPAAVAAALRRAYRAAAAAGGRARAGR